MNVKQDTYSTIADGDTVKTDCVFHIFESDKISSGTIIVGRKIMSKYYMVYNFAPMDKLEIAYLHIAEKEKDYVPGKVVYKPTV